MKLKYGWFGVWKISSSYVFINNSERMEGVLFRSFYIGCL